MLTIHKDSHLDHGLTQAHVDFLVEHFKDREGFFIETITLPDHLDAIPCGLYGPAMGDQPVMESEVYYARRGDRDHISRLINRPLRPTRQVTVIAGSYDGLSCVLFTAYGGAAAPQEPAEPGLKEHAREASRAFWSQHALVDPDPGEDGACAYCGGNCPSEPEDSEYLCDGYAGDVDNLYS